MKNTLDVLFQTRNKTCRLGKIFFKQLTRSTLIFSGGFELVEKLLKDEKFTNNKSAKTGVEEMKLLFKYCQLFGCIDNVSE